jgi:hypothetical protein
MLERVAEQKTAILAVLPETSCPIQNITQLQWKVISQLASILEPLNKQSLA